MTRIPALDKARRFTAASIVAAALASGAITVHLADANSAQAETVAVTTSSSGTAAGSSSSAVTTSGDSSSNSFGSTTSVQASNGNAQTTTSGS